VGGASLYGYCAGGAIRGRDPLGLRAMAINPWDTFTEYSGYAVAWAAVHVLQFVSAHSEGGWFYFGPHIQFGESKLLGIGITGAISIDLNWTDHFFDVSYMGGIDASMGGVGVQGGLGTSVFDVGVEPSTWGYVGMQLGGVEYGWTIDSSEFKVKNYAGFSFDVPPGAPVTIQIGINLEGVNLENNMIYYADPSANSDVGESPIPLWWNDGIYLTSGGVGGEMLSHSLDSDGIYLTSGGVGGDMVSHALDSDGIYLTTGGVGVTGVSHALDSDGIYFGAGSVGGGGDSHSLNNDGIAHGLGVDQGCGSSSHLLDNDGIFFPPNRSEPSTSPGRLWGRIR